MSVKGSACVIHISLDVHDFDSLVLRTMYLKNHIVNRSVKLESHYNNIRVHVVLLYPI